MNMKKATTWAVMLAQGIIMTAISAILVYAVFFAPANTGG